MIDTTSRYGLFPLLAAAFIASTATACTPKDQSQPANDAPAAWNEDWADYKAAIIDTGGDAVGSAAFKQGPRGVLFRIDVSRLPDGWHGLHFHSVGTCSDYASGFKASGGHINPDGVAHGLLHPDGAHRADLPNLYVQNGRAIAEIYRPGVFLSPTANSLEGAVLKDADGSALVIHAAEDDHITQPIGGAGARIACAALGGTAE